MNPIQRASTVAALWVTAVTVSVHALGITCWSSPGSFRPAFSAGVFFKGCQTYVRSSMRNTRQSSLQFCGWSPENDEADEFSFRISGVILILPPSLAKGRPSQDLRRIGKTRGWKISALILDKSDNTTKEKVPDYDYTEVLHDVYPRASERQDHVRSALLNVLGTMFMEVSGVVD
ncbi:hypothetical protein R1flu_013317 [Riccia fluitans]|uniref:Uncharacterized protein n=1 Tax=Riccia fluitans TaxID=41844 RepID=A0ABD1YCX7_9MARC